MLSYFARIIIPLDRLIYFEHSLLRLHMLFILLTILRMCVSLVSQPQV